MPLDHDLHQQPAPRLSIDEQPAQSGACRRQLVKAALITDERVAELVQRDAQVWR
jgi:hypothetical protein